MSPRFASLLLSSSLLSAAALAGCAEPAEPAGARFAEATPAQIDRAFAAATEHEAIPVLLLAHFLAGEHDPAGCPSIVTSGGDTTVTGDCTQDGRGFRGTIAIHDFPDLEGPLDADTLPRGSVEIDATLSSPKGEQVSLFGRVELEVRVGALKLIIDLTTDFDGIASTSRLTLDCEPDGVCTAAPGSEIELAGLGRAGVEGTWSLRDEQDGSVTVRGADTLVFDMTGIVGNRCAPYELGDKRGEACRPKSFLHDFVTSGLAPSQAVAEPRVLEWWY